MSVAANPVHTGLPAPGFDDNVPACFPNTSSRESVTVMR